MGKANLVKTVYNLVAECKDPRVGRAILNGALDKLVKTIYKEIVKGERLDRALNKRQKQTFKKNRNAIISLTIASCRWVRRRSSLRDRVVLSPSSESSSQPP